MTVADISVSQQDLHGRQCYLKATHVIATVEPADASGPTITVRLEAGHLTAVRPEEMIVLPRIGAYVSTVGAVGWSTGFWLGFTSARVSDRPVAVFVTPSGVYQGTFSLTMLEQLAEVDVPEGFTAASALELLQRHHERWTGELVEDAKEWADDHDLCSKFDEFMHEHGLGSREATYRVDTEVRLDVSVLITGRSPDHAREEVDSDDIRQAIAAGLYTIDDYDTTDATRS